MLGLNIIGAKTVLLCCICSMFGRPYFDMFTMFSLYSLYICTTISYACPVLHDFIHTWCMYSDSYISIPHVLTTFMVFFSHKPLQGSTRVLNPLVLNMGSSSTDIGRTPSEYTTSWHQVTYPYDLLYTCGHDPMRPNIFFNPAWTDPTPRSPQYSV